MIWHQNPDVFRRSGTPGQNPYFVEFWSFSCTNVVCHVHIPEFTFCRCSLTWLSFSSVFVLRSHSPIYQTAVSTFLHTQGHKNLIQLLTLSHPYDSFFTQNSSNQQLRHIHPLSLLCVALPLLSVMTYDVWQTGSQTHRWCNVWGTGPSHIWFPTLIYPYRFKCPLIAGTGSSIKHLPSLSAIIFNSCWIYFCTKRDFSWCFCWVIFTGLQFKQFIQKDYFLLQNHKKRTEFFFKLMLIKSFVKEDKSRALNALCIL